MVFGMMFWCLRCYGVLEDKSKLEQYVLQPLKVPPKIKTESEGEKFPSFVLSSKLQEKNQTKEKTIPDREHCSKEIRSAFQRSVWRAVLEQVPGGPLCFLQPLLILFSLQSAPFTVSFNSVFLTSLSTPDVCFSFSQLHFRFLNHKKKQLW